MLITRVACNICCASLAGPGLVLIFIVSFIARFIVVVIPPLMGVVVGRLRRVVVTK